MKKAGLILSLIVISILSISLISAAGEKFDVSAEVISEKSVRIIASLYDSSNNPIDSPISVIIEDANKINKIDTTVQSNKPSDISLGDKAPAGFWTATAEYISQTGDKTTATLVIFEISSTEDVKFEIKNSTLIITNTGNTRYTKDVQIAIGDTIGIKSVDLAVGEKASFKLVAPEGSYTIKVTDGKNSLILGNTALTGNAIGVLDERTFTKNPLTGTGDPESPQSATNGTNTTVVWVFLMALFGASILLVIERRFRRSAMHQ